MSDDKVLVVEDDEGGRFFLSEFLKKEGREFEIAKSGEDALELMRSESFLMAILDYNLPGMNGLDTFSRLREIDAGIEGIMITAFGNKDLAMDAMNAGVMDFFNKPLELSEMRVVVRRAWDRAKLRREVETLRAENRRKFGLDRLLGSSPGVQAVKEQIRMVANNDVSVLIQGESGTGKELVAQALHYMSPRCNQPFVKVNCAALPADLLEAEFFGYEKGAFTGAVKQRRGKFEMASSGTLFLDEIGDMTAATQMKILRAIQEGEIERIGGEKTIRVDIRIIAATNKDLERAVEEKEFREDLFYRLNVVGIHLPPLRERTEDIAEIATHFLDVYNGKFNKEIQSISDDAMQLFLNYSWPGNIRELENIIQRGIVLAYNDKLEKEDFLRVYPSLGNNIPDPSPDLSLHDNVEAAVAWTEKRMILEALKDENWRRQETSDRLGISRKSLHNKMKKYGIGE
ncbi:MAG: sigma-54-dependent Fis family transcriptional regulator [Candidatus Nitrohelix vancouverensis]|uniref:Sigma-54-dependent Fis family transcriptional regulator n=1 Tax=Candidatus Nitrohelix vancouverensis TaxID=2705534 RepID=A0A7T0C1L6_9BACT|nr:MAG: sigma-54-dependent Fis family transcriptional regulator [Candidatus Nitrohelix vancouverensis]